MLAQSQVLNTSRGAKLARVLQIEERLKDLNDVLSAWLPKSGDVLYQAWTWFKASNYSCLPYAGGLLDQPVWVLNEFAMFDLIEEYYALSEELQRITSESSDEQQR